ncbi:hypothetical protein IOK_12672, partial [Yersinia enterocolitica subsp. palearctica PhRBD_Ye1]
MRDASPDKLAINSCFSDNQEGNHAFPRLMTNLADLTCKERTG